MSQNEIKQTELAIIGGGLFGSLLANELLNHSVSFAIFEKEAQLGGRVKSTDLIDRIWSYGLGQIDEDLYKYIENLLKADPEHPGLEKPHQLLELGCLSAGKLSKKSLAKINDGSAAKMLAGGAGVKAWKTIRSLIQEVADGKKKDQLWQTLWTGKRKDPGGIVLEQVGRLIGLPDIWSSSATQFEYRLKQFTEQNLYPNWREFFQTTETRISVEPLADLHLNTTIADVRHLEEEQLWRITTQKGLFHSKKLIIASSPWDALNWLSKDAWPADLLQLALKAKPASMVSISENIAPEKLAAAELADIQFLPAENTQIIVSPNGDISYQATLDFEISVQAPDVVKAVKRLRRTRKKFLQYAIENGAQISLDDDSLPLPHIALLATAWTEPSNMQDEKWFKKTWKLTNQLLSQDQQIYFIGDCYLEQDKSTTLGQAIQKEIKQITSTLCGDPLPNTHHTEEDIIPTAESHSEESEL